MNEVLTMQKKHAEVARLTYAKHIARCETIYGRVSKFSVHDLEDDAHVNVTMLA